MFCKLFDANFILTNLIDPLFIVIMEASVRRPLSMLLKLSGSKTHYLNELEIEGAFETQAKFN